MAFLNFLKKTKKDMPGKDSLDMPPPPPIPGLKARQRPKDEMALDSMPPPDMDFGAPPYPMPPTMADSPPAPPQNMDFKQDDNDFAMMPPPGMPSKEELGLEAPASDSDFGGDFPSFDAATLEAPPVKPQLPRQNVQQSTPQAAVYQRDEPPQEEMEAPPVPKRRIKSSYEMFDREIKEAEKSRKRVPSSGPLFVTMPEFQDILDKNDYVKLKLKESNDTLERVSKLQSNIHDNYEKWRQEIADLQKRLLLVDKKLFELEA